MKTKLILLGILLPIVELISLWLSTLAHLSLTIGTYDKSQLAFKNCIEIIATNKTAWLLFLCLSGISLLSIIMLIFYNRNNIYESNLNKITKKISTPVTAGQKQFGSANWMDKKDFDVHFDHLILNHNTSSIKSGGAVIGMSKKHKKEKVYYIGDDIHTLCIGSTRSGKSRCVVLQSIGLLGLAGESMIISDPKSELFNYTTAYLKAKGYEVIAIDFKNPLKSHRYNFLQNVIDAVKDNDIPKAIDYAWDITSSLVGKTKGERIWNDGEASIIASSILTVVYDNHHNPEYQNLTNVYYFIANMCQMAGDDLPLNKYMKTLPNTHPAKALLGISEVAPSRTRGSFFTSALTTLRLFTNPLIYSMTCTSDFKPSETGTVKRALFIILPDEKVTYYSLASLFASQQYELLISNADQRGGRLKRRVNFILDEFGNFTKIPSFANKLTVGGGRGIRFNLFVQSLSQIDEKYGRDNATTIKGNCAIWIYLCADDPHTLNELSKRLGNYTVATHSKSSSYSRNSSGSSSSSVNLTGRPLLTSDEVRLIDRPYSLITSRSNPAIMHAPDLSEYAFNKLFGLGDIDHNRKIRQEREDNRPQRSENIGDIKLWNIWDKFKQSQDNIKMKNAGFYPAQLD